MLSDFAQPDSLRAQEVGRLLARRLIRRLQSVIPGLLEDEGAANLWDEICVQTRRESVLTDLYRDEMTKHLGILVARLSTVDRLAIWLDTYSGECLVGDDDATTIGFAIASMRDDDIIQHVMVEHVAYESMNYENARIKNMLGE